MFHPAGACVVWAWQIQRCAQVLLLLQPHRGDKIRSGVQKSGTYLQNLYYCHVNLKIMRKFEESERKKVEVSEL